MNILIAEDDELSGLVLQSSLEDLGHAVTLEENGEEAWRLIQEDRFSIVISDWMMPKMDGLELCRRVRSREGHSYTYIILLTSKSLPEDRQVGLNAGADDFLVKPLDPAELVARLEVARRILSMQAQLKDNSQQFERLQGELQQQHVQLGSVLVSQGALTQSQLNIALEQQSGTQIRLGALLIANGWATDEQITRARSVQIDVAYVDVSEEAPDPFVLALVPSEVAQRYKLLPLSVQDSHPGGIGRLKVAMVDPWNIEAIDFVQRQTGRRIEPLLASEGGMSAALARIYEEIDGDERDAVIKASFEQVSLDEANIDEIQEDVDVAEVLRQSDQVPVIRFVNTLIADAVRRRASDIHLEPHKQHFEVLYRIDGQLQSMRTVPRQFLASTTSRIKIMAEMDISERRLPLDGRIALRVDGRGIDLRISTLPTQFGERTVMRILDRTSACLTLNQLGFSEHNGTAFNSLIQKPHGIILVTGPTGSGKTTTLYAALNALITAGREEKRQKKNIITCEDPIEYELDGVSQSAVNERAGLTFARQLRAILRQDPDVLLVGEIRDAETAEIAFRAALTGHLVFSTLHCNEAAGAVSRLLDMGVPSYLIASTLIGVVGQRLVRRLCPDCRRPITDSSLVTAFQGSKDVLDLEGPFYETVGCIHCDQLGTRGRLAVHEVMVVNSRIQRLTMEQAETAVIRSAAIDAGMIPMIGDSLNKARQGLTTLQDIHGKVGIGFAA